MSERDKGGNYPRSTLEIEAMVAVVGVAVESGVELGVESGVEFMDLVIQ